MLFFAFLTALFVSMVLVAVLAHFARRFNFVDLPDPRKVHTVPIPRVGGIGMVLGAAVAVLAWSDPGSSLRAFLAGVMVLSLFGIWDDRADLDYRLKFAGQSLAVAIVMAEGGVLIEHLPWLEADGLPGWAAYPLTFFFLLGATNATNLADGLDGLAAGLSLLSLACIAYLADLGGNGSGDEVILAAVAIMGATLGFLRYNTHPAQVFMGDTGSQFLGFSLGVLVLLLTQRVNTALTPGLALLVLGLPIIDTLAVMGQRLARGLSPFKPDRNHFHHKLLSLGFDQYEAVLAIYAIQALFVVAAYLLRYQSYGWLALLYGSLATGIVLFYPLAQRLGWQLHPRRVSPLARGVRFLLATGHLDSLPQRLLGLAIPAFLVAGAALGAKVDRDLGYLIAAIMPLALGCRLLRLPLAAWAERLALYSGVILVVYALEAAAPLAGTAAQAGLRYFFLALAGLIAVGVRFSRAYFSVTPSDFLVLFILLAAANLPAPGAAQYARLAIRAAVVLYGLEFVLRGRQGVHLALWAGTLAALAVLGVRAVC